MKQCYDMSRHSSANCSNPQPQGQVHQRLEQRVQASQKLELAQRQHQKRQAQLVPVNRKLKAQAQVRQTLELEPLSRQNCPQTAAPVQLLRQRRSRCWARIQRPCLRKALLLAPVLVMHQMVQQSRSQTRLSQLVVLVQPQQNRRQSRCHRSLQQHRNHRPKKCQRNRHSRVLQWRLLHRHRTVRLWHQR